MLDLELETERYTRAAEGRWRLRRAQFELGYDIVTVRATGLARTFHELQIRELRAGSPNLDQLASAVRERHGLRAVTTHQRVRGALVRAALESEALARGVAPGRWVAVVAVDGAKAACVSEGSGATLRLPVAEGSGEAACRHLMREVLGNAIGELHLLSTVRGEGRVRSLEVWIARRVDRSGPPSPGVDWVPLNDLLALVGTPAIVDSQTLGALAALADSELLPRLTTPTLEAERPTHVVSLSAPPPNDPAKGPLLDGDVSLLAFNERVLELAEDEATPLLERVRFLSIVSANVDEFFQVRVGDVMYGGESAGDEADARASVDERLGELAPPARALVARQYQCFDDVRRALESRRVRVRTHAELKGAQRAFLHTHFRAAIFPYLTPRAITSTPGHPFPIMPDRTLCLAVALRDQRGGGPLSFADLALPATIPRFVQLPDTTDFVPVEEVIRPELPTLYPGRRVVEAHLFRVTRHADLDVDERLAGDLLQAVEEGSQRRRHLPVVRIEVERAMPAPLRELLLRELQLEPGARPGTLGERDVYEIDGLMDLGRLDQLASVPLGELRFPPHVPNTVADDGRPLWDRLRERDLFVHHPYDDFGATVVRFFAEAADDPDVAAIKVTLYRAGERSPIVDALLRAAEAGKDVTVFVELKARFDEQRNVRWARRLEAAGVHVVHGLVGVKNHSKVALVVRDEGGVPRWYAHVGTGNYNADSARFYTDFGLLTARSSLCADVHDLFNALTGSSVPTALRYRECLVAPAGLLRGLLTRIEREAEHARAGRPARIRMKLNGLSDREVVWALYRAAQAGVDVDLVVRGICTLAPGVPGVSERIRVVSVLGRFLEHARVYAFANGGAPEYFIGSADLRPRNLRRRVEVLAPVHDADARARLDAILDRELARPDVWELHPDGRYVRRAGVSANGAALAPAERGAGVP
jgi:polyphosphate kinase